MANVLAWMSIFRETSAEWLLESVVWLLNLEGIPERFFTDIRLVEVKRRRCREKFDSKQNIGHIIPTQLNMYLRLERGIVHCCALEFLAGIF